MVVVTVVQLARVAYLAASDADVVLSTGMLVLAFVVTVVWLMTVFWVAVGSWRRSVWGCPFDHLETSPPSRRCPRHQQLVDPAAEGHDHADVHPPQDTER